jgi:hypothetical protein
MPMTPPNITKDSVRVTKVIDELIWAFPESSPRKIAELLTYRLYPSDPLEKHYNEVKTYYSNMISVRKSQLKKWRATKVYGRPQKALVSAHRFEWEVERGLPVDLLVKVKATAGLHLPRVEDAKPVGVWYVIPNRNRQLEYHDEFVSVRVMPQSGTVRILPAVDLDYKEFEDRVWDAFLKAELTSKECDRIAQALRVSDRHKTFRVGPVTPFKIDYYRDSLGLVIGADGSHPCLVPGSLIVTKRGLKPIEMVCEGDEVLTHRGRFRRVLQIMHREYIGDVSTIQPCYGLPYTLTVEHPVYATNIHKGQRSVRARALKWIPSGDLQKGDFTCFPLIDRHAIPVKAFCSRRSNQYSSKREIVKLVPDVLRLIGYYLGDGSPTGHCETKIVLNKDQQVEALDIQQTVKTHLSASVRIYPEDNTLVVVFSHVSFQRYLTKVYGSSALTKRIPWFFLQLSKESKIELLKGLFGSDGSSGKYKGYLRYAFVTTSPDLAIKIVQLLLSLKLFASINVVDKVGQKTVSDKVPNGIISRNPCYYVNVNGLSASKLHELFFGCEHVDLKICSFNHGFFSHRTSDEVFESGKRHRYRLDRYAMTPIREVTKGHYNGQVFNLRVEEDDSYCLPYLTVHNCHIETHESWPTWIQPQLRALGLQTTAITQLTEQIRLHLEVMKGIDTSTRLNAEATKKLAEVVDRLYRLMGFERARKRQLTEKDQKKLSDF